MSSTTAMYKYQWEKLVNRKPKKRLSAFCPLSGPRVIERFKNGTAKLTEFRLYVKHKYARISLIGSFNDWGKQHSDKFLFRPDKKNEYYLLKMEDGAVKHIDPYLLLVNGEYRRDPASVYFDDKGNSVFWDFGDPSAYRFKSPQLDLVNRSTKILQTDLPGLITHYRGRGGKLGWQVSPDRYYKFIIKSGVIQKIKSLGFNTIQFLPVARSIDGNKWSLRYLVPFLYSINNYWGTPDEFAEMVDVFHEHGIAVILDLVVSHAPYKDFSLFNLPAKDIGIHRWQKGPDRSLFLGETTHWGTKRYNMADENVRKFIIDSAVSYIRNYNIDGFRIDNVDGIIRHGKNGQGKERRHGRTFLRELTQTAYDYRPHTIFHFESHYFHGDNAKWLVAPLKESRKALGATAYTSSRLTYYLHKELMPKSSDHVSVWQFKNIVDEKEGGDSNSTVADFHNHDAAAGLMESRATGSYAYDALILGNPELHYHATGKIKAMEALISFGTEGRTLDLLQTFLLQTGTFEHDSTIKWYLEQVEANGATLNFKKRVNEIMDEPAFWPANVRYRKYINLDSGSNTVTILRSSSSPKAKTGFLIVINISNKLTTDFVIPAPKKATYELIMNSDEFQYAGSGRTFYSKYHKSETVDMFEFFKYGLRLDTVPPYGILVFKF